MCSDPLHPVLSPGNGDYSYYGLNSTASALLFTAWHKEPGVVASACDAAGAAGVSGAGAACAAFNSDGKMFVAGGQTVAAPGKTTWVRRTA